MVEFLTPLEMIAKMAEIIEEERRYQKLQQKELALKAGIPLPTYKDFIYKDRISFENLLKIMIALNMFEKISALLKEREIKSIDELKNKPKLPKRIVK